MKSLLEQLNAMRPTDEESDPAPILDNHDIISDKKKEDNFYTCEYCGRKWLSMSTAKICNQTDKCRAKRDDAPKIERPPWETEPEKKLDKPLSGKLEVYVSGVLHSTEKAVLYKLRQDGMEMQFWIPKKKHEFDADRLLVTYPDWFSLNIAPYEPFVPRKRRDFS